MGRDGVVIELREDSLHYFTQQMELMSLLPIFTLFLCGLRQVPFLTGLLLNQINCVCSTELCVRIAGENSYKILRTVVGRYKELPCVTQHRGI